MQDRNPPEESGPSQGALQDSWEDLRSDVLTHAMDFSIDSLARLSEQGDLLNHPPFKRRARWDLTQNSRFIESLLLNIPTPPLFFAEDTETYQYSVIDGTQRLDAVFMYLQDSYRLTGLESLTAANNLKFSDLPQRMQRHLLRTTMRAVIISPTSRSDIRTTVFARLNSGGTRLNVQEMRNALDQGPFNSLTIELAESPDFQQALGAGLAYSRSMRDVELVLRYFALSDGYVQPSTPTSQALTQALQHKNKSTTEALREDRRSFEGSLKKCLTAFGSDIFRRWRPEVNKVDSRISIPLYDAQMLAVRDFSIELISIHDQHVREGMRTLFHSSEFTNTLKSNVHFKHSLDFRVNAIAGMIESVAR